MAVRVVLASVLALLSFAAGPVCVADPAPAASATLDVPADAPGAAEWVQAPPVEIPASYEIRYVGLIPPGVAQIEVRKWFGGDTWATARFTVTVGGAIGGAKRVDGTNRDFATGEMLVHVPVTEALLVNGERVDQPVRVRDPSGQEREVPLARTAGSTPRRRLPEPPPEEAPDPEEGPTPTPPEDPPPPEGSPAPDGGERQGGGGPAW
ncbi:MAG: hypothetical protein HY608_03110 [Planctomycetes bacterium]|nr:hypothetical protein [Planctomycetota bacterium]